MNYYINQYIPSADSLKNDKAFDLPEKDIEDLARIIISQSPEISNKSLKNDDLIANMVARIYFAYGMYEDDHGKDLKSYIIDHCNWEISNYKKFLHKACSCRTAGTLRGFKQEDSSYHKQQEIDELDLINQSFDHRQDIDIAIKKILEQKSFREISDELHISTHRAVQIWNGIRRRIRFRIRQFEHPPRKPAGTR